ncbi:hypothetical protein K438DRAFT_645520 [Mycena galopus ATCC 62051]|nr:hypothetical protein K438DRAFT_645520 [Mycena galopus ATCC 62051]
MPFAVRPTSRTTISSGRHRCPPLLSFRLLSQASFSSGCLYAPGVGVLSGRAGVVHGVPTSRCHPSRVNTGIYLPSRAHIGVYLPSPVRTGVYRLSRPNTRIYLPCPRMKSRALAQCRHMNLYRVIMGGPQHTSSPHLTILHNTRTVPTVVRLEPSYGSHLVLSATHLHSV